MLLLWEGNWERAGGVGGVCERVSRREAGGGQCVACVRAQRWSASSRDQTSREEEKTSDLGKENLLGRGYLSLSTLSLRGISTLDTVS